MNFISKSACLALALLVAVPAAFGSKDNVLSPNKGGDKAKTSSAGAPQASGSFLNTISFGLLGSSNKDASAGVEGAACGCNYFWPLIAGGSTVAGIAAYKYVPQVKQKVDAGLKFTKEKAEALSKSVKAKLSSLDKPFSQADALLIGVGGGLVYYFGASTVETVKSAAAAGKAKSVELTGKVADNEYVKEYVLKNNWTRAATVAASIALPVLTYKAYKAYQARQKTAPKSNVVKPSIISVAQAA